MIHFERRAVEIRDRLARHLCEEANQNFEYLSIRSRWQGEAQSRIDAWLRSPKELASDADRICEEARQNQQAMDRARVERAEARRALREAQQAPEAPDPTIATVNVRDAVSGKIWAISLPVDQVRQIITNRLSGY